MHRRATAVQVVFTPYAGITRIRFGGRRRPAVVLSARLPRAPATLWRCGTPMIPARPAAGQEDLLGDDTGGRSS